MGFFDRPDDYSKMLDRMAIVTGIVVFICSAFVIQALSEKGITLPSPRALADQEISIFGFKGSLWALFPTLLIAWIFRRVRMHDRISDVFKIREAFDTHVILVRLAGETGIPIGLSEMKKLRSERQDLMYKVFYPYVDSHAPKISKHHVAEALDAWFGYWIALETAVVLIPFGLALLSLGASASAAVFLAVAIICILVGIRYFRSCSPLAEHEISAMKTHPDWTTWKQEIKKHFEDAIQS